MMVLGYDFGEEGLLCERGGWEMVSVGKKKAGREFPAGEKEAIFLGDGAGLEPATYAGSIALRAPAALPLWSYPSRD